jgi:hypothetical protein
MKIARVIPSYFLGVLESISRGIVEFGNLSLSENVNIFL